MNRCRVSNLASLVLWSKSKHLRNWKQHKYRENLDKLINYTNKDNDLQIHILSQYHIKGIGAQNASTKVKISTWQVHIDDEGTAVESLT